MPFLSNLVVLLLDCGLCTCFLIEAINVNKKKINTNLRSTLQTQTHVDDDAQFSNVLHFSCQQLPDRFLLVTLTLAQRLVIGHDLRPMAFEVEAEWVVVRSAKGQVVRGLGQTVYAVLVE